MSETNSRHRFHAGLYIIAAIGLASTQDAIVKVVSGSYPVYETVIMRSIVSFPILAFWLFQGKGRTELLPTIWPRLLLRSLILVSAYFAFILSIAAIPIANAVAIYFTMPFFVAASAGYFLREKVPLYRWIAIIVGFAGVLVMVRPGAESFQPAALLALYSSFGYAVGQMMGRHLSQTVEPLVIANWHNTTLFTVAVIIAIVAQFTGYLDNGDKSLAFLTRPFVSPTVRDFFLMAALGGLAAFAMVCFVKAYSLAEANFVAPFEYSGMIWAVTFGVLLFGDFPDFWTWVGTAIVMGAGLFMLIMDRRYARGYPAQPLTVRNANDD